MHTNLPHCDIADIQQAASAYHDLAREFRDEADAADLANKQDRKHLADYAAEIINTLNDLNQYEDADLDAVLNAVRAAA